MLARRLAVLMSLAATLLLGGGLVSPAGAVLVPMTATDPVTNLVVSAVQTPGAHDRWTVSATWDDNGAGTYTASIVPNADGSGTPYAGPQDVGTPSVTFPPTSGLLDGSTYYVAVYPKAAGASAVTTTVFQAPTLDRTAPSATYTVDRTTAYLTSPDGDLLADQTATFTITQTALSDPSTPVSRKVDLGDGGALKTWSSGSTFALSYANAGSFHPRVIVTDSFGNANTVALPVLNVVHDGTKPVVTITIPSAPNLISSWRVVRGTSKDSGVGVLVSAAVLAQKRGGIWYAYDFHKRIWVKGYAKVGKTLHRKAVPAFMPSTSSGAWHTPKVRGLRGGPLRVEALALDNSFNVGRVKVDRKIH